MKPFQQPAKLLQTLIRFDTTNPPGNEAACIRFLAGILEEAGIKTRLLAKEENRPNLIARLQGDGSAPMKLPPDFDFLSTFHAADERIPVEAVGFGTEAIFMALQQYGRSE